MASLPFVGDLTVALRICRPGQRISERWEDEGHD
jgi:hypothetical protein